MVPNYDEFTVINGNANTPEMTYFTATMTLTCALGYDFHQEQITQNTQSVTVECGFMGVWKDYSSIPRCTRKWPRILINIFRLPV